MNKNDYKKQAETHRLGLGNLKILQHPDIFKFTVDPILLSAFVRVRVEDKVLDLGTGVGVIPLWLAGYRGIQQIVGLEIQEQVADLAEENVKLNGFEDRLKIIRGDLRTPPPELTGGKFDWVVSNPPYWPPNSKTLPIINPVLARAKFELTCNLEQVVSTASRLCRGNGRVGFIHLAERLTDLLYLMRKHQLEPKRLCVVYPKPGSAPRRVLVEGKKNSSPGLIILAPFYIQQENGEFTPEMMEVYKGKPLF